MDENIDPSIASVSCHHHSTVVNNKRILSPSMSESKEIEGKKKKRKTSPVHRVPLGPRGGDGGSVSYFDMSDDNSLFEGPYSHEKRRRDSVSFSEREPTVLHVMSQEVKEDTHIHQGMVFHSVAEAVKESVAHDSILIHPGVYEETAPILIDKPGIRITCVEQHGENGAPAAVLRGSNLRSAFISIRAPAVHLCRLQIELAESVKVPAIHIHNSGRHYTPYTATALESTDVSSQTITDSSSSSKVGSKSNTLKSKLAIRITHCSITSSDCGILITKGSHHEEQQYPICIQHNHVHQTGKTGIYWKHHSRGIVSHNHIEKCSCSGILLVMGGSDREGRQRRSSLSSSSDIQQAHGPITLVISDNEIHNCKQSGIWIRGGQPVNERRKNENDDAAMLPPCTERGDQQHDTQKNGFQLMIQKNSIHHNDYPNVVVSDHACPTIYKNEIHHSRQNGICVRNSSRPNVQYNRVYNNFYCNVHVQNDAEPLLKHNDLRGARSGGVWCKDRARCQMFQCDIHNNEYHGVVAEDDSCITMEHCHVHTNARKGVCFKGRSKGVIRHNNIYMNKDCNVEIGGQSCPILSRNDIYESEKCGVLIKDRSNPQLLCNRIHHNTHPNVCLFGSASGKLQDNDIFQSMQSGMVVRDDCRSKIVGNRFHGNKFSNVKIGGRAQPLFQFNRVFNAGQSGIWCKDECRPRVIDNEIMDNTRENLLIDLLTACPVVENNKTASAHNESRGDENFNSTEHADRFSKDSTFSGEYGSQRLTLSLDI